MSGASAVVTEGRRKLLLALAGLLAVAGVLVAVTHDGPSALDRARAELASDGAFTRSSTAGEALLRASTELQRAGAECEADDARCDRLLTAAAMARVSSVQLLSCRRPEVFAFRDEFRTYLDGLAEGDDPTPPRPPACD